MEKQSPFLRLWELGESEHTGLIRAMISAAAGVLSGMLLHYAAAQIIIAPLNDNREWSFYLSEMNAAVVENIGGIEVIKAFNQGKNSYAKFSDRVLANAAYYYNWMKDCQLPTSLAKAAMPTTLITVLTVGWLLYSSGSLSVEVFITTLTVSLGIAGPLLAAMNLMDSLAKIGTIVGRRY